MAPHALPTAAALPLPTTAPFPLLLPLGPASSTASDDCERTDMGQASSTKLAAVAVLQAQLEAVASGTAASRAPSLDGVPCLAPDTLRKRGSSLSTASCDTPPARAEATPPSTTQAPPVRSSSLRRSGLDGPRSPRTKGRSLSSSERTTPFWIDTENPVFPAAKRASTGTVHTTRLLAPDKPLVMPDKNLVFPGPRSKSSASTLATIPSSPLPLLDAPSAPLTTPFFIDEVLKPSFAITPPSATLPSSRSWPLPALASIYARPDLAASAPDLASAEVASSSVTRSVSDQGATHSVYSLKHTSDVSLAVVGREEKRYHALLELVETEKGYLDSLRVLVKGYFQTLPFLDVLTSADIASVVRNADALLELHERIAVRLIQVEQELGWMSTHADPKVTDAKVRGAAGRVARVFIDELPNFRLYDEFCAQHGEALDVVRSVESRPEWEVYERQCALATSIQSKDSSNSNSGESTPIALAQTSSSPFFPIIITSSASDSNATICSSPTSETPPRKQAPAPPSQHHKLRFLDYAIKPIQRICRYPLVLGAVLKNLGECPERDDVKAAWDGMRKAVEGVDEAKRLREGELRTRIVAARMEFQAPIGWAFCDVLGPTLLIGTLHVLHRSPLADSFRSKYYGCFLYRSHLVMVKIRKRDSYEPRHWLPLRQFTIESVDDGEGFLALSIRMSYQDHHFELGATCAAEKGVWLDHLVAAQHEAHRQWDEQPLDDAGQPTLFDDALVSSVLAGAAPTPTASSSTARRPHVRSTSAVSARSYSQQSSTPASDRRHSYFDDQPPMPTSPVVATSPTLVAAPMPYPTVNRNRFSTTASSLLGRTPSTQRQTIDVRLADVFSEECLAARAQAARAPAGFAAGSVRRRAISSGPKASAGPVHSFGRMTAKERRRMSCIDVGANAALDPDFRGAVGFDVELAQVYRDESTDRRWSAALKRSKSGLARTRPVLPDIDTALAEASKQRVTGTGTWKSRAMSLRRAASQSSLGDARGRSPVNSAVFSTSPTATAAEVERNNSVSSNASSSGTHSTSYSRRATETPLSSLPPSPELGKADFEHFGRSPPTPGAVSRWPAGQSLSDGVSSALKLKRRGIQLALPTPGVLEHSHSEPIASFGGASLSRRSSTISTFFSKRVQSSPALTSFFGTGHSSSANSSRGTLSSASTPYLLSTSSETVSPDWSPPSTAPPSPAFGIIALHSSIETTASPIHARLSPGAPEVALKKGKALSMRFKFQASNALSPVV